MKQSKSLKSPGNGRKGLAILILFVLILKLGFLGYLYASSKKGKIVTTSFLTQAIAQEEVPEEMVVAHSSVDGEEELKSLSLLNKRRQELDQREEKLKQEEER
ncbi:MAG: hypothetical protein JSV11_00740, partial [Nitrospiraceae bacterium]